MVGLLEQQFFSKCKEFSTLIFGENKILIDRQLLSSLLFLLLQ